MLLNRLKACTGVQYYTGPVIMISLVSQDTWISLHGSKVHWNQKKILMILDLIRATLEFVFVTILNF